MMAPAGMFTDIPIVFFVTISGVPVDDTRNPKNGMVIDFADLKNIVL